MALTNIIRKECPTCGKIAVEVSRSKFGNAILIKLACGHMLRERALDTTNLYESIRSSDGKSLKPYQIEGVKFLERANAKAILADEQGLGKTIQALALLRLHPDELLPAVLVVPSSVKIQWHHEILRWCCPNGTKEEKIKFLTQVIHTSKEKALPGFAIYIVTYDILKVDGIFDDVEIKTVIADECQRVKNHLSGRAKALQNICKTVEHKIPMSGTYVKNNAGEGFTSLNLVAPTRFPHYQRYITDYCDSYSNGWGTKVGGLRNPARFHEDTKDIILRRTKKDVLKDLPPLDRKFYHVDLDPRFNKAYAAALRELDELIYSDENEFSKGAATIAIMTKMRHITGLSKVPECVDFVTEFLDSSERKITIFTHHQDVMDLLNAQLNNVEGANPLVLHAGLDSLQRHDLIEKFKNSNSRVMIASTLAAGEGLNLQFCSDAIMLERQWNPANEGQAEARFHRFGQELPVIITYIIALGTIDEYFTELVEVKRGIVASVLDNESVQWDQQSLMKELTQVLVTKGRERWKL